MHLITLNCTFKQLQAKIKSGDWLNNMKKFKNLKNPKHLKGSDTMKKAISTVWVVTMLATGAGSAFASTPIDVDKKCMHLNDMLEYGYWTNGKEAVCNCDSCQVILADYDHLDQMFDKT